MKKRNLTRIQRTALAGMVIGGLCGGLPTALKAAEATPKADAPKAAEKSAAEAELEEFTHWLELSAGGVSIDGNRAAFQQRHQLTQGAFGGIEDAHWERKLGKTGFLKLDGRALFDQHDYQIKLEVTKEKLGFLRGGYKQFRTWSDGSGGFFPTTGSWLDLFDDALALDRGEAWVEGGLTLKDLPTLTFKYTHQFRDGYKDSTSWGFFRPSGAGPVRSISPSFLDIDETRDIFQADMRHTIGKTLLGTGIRYDASKTDDARKMRLWPNSVPPSPDVDSRVTHRDIVWSDVLNAHAFTETRFNQKVFLSSGYSFTTLDTDLSGSRIYGNDYDAGYVPALATGPGFYGLTGGSKMKEHVVNLNLMLTPLKDFTVTPSLRINRMGADSWSWFMQTGPSSGASSSVSERDILDVTEQLELRYTGITNWVLYARGEWTQGDGDLTEAASGPAITGIFPPNRYSEDSREIQKYTAGANWYPLRNLNFDAQYYHKRRRNEYGHVIDSTSNSGSVPISGNRYPAYVTNNDFDTDDVNLRMTFRPFQKLSLVSRYDFQVTSIDTTPDALSLLGETESARINSHVFSQNATYVPWSRLYLQGAFSYVASKTESPVTDYTQAVLDAKNNYWTLNFTAGFVLDNKTDLTTQYYYYRAANNYSDNSAFGVPYGADAREHAVTCGLTRKLKPNMQLGLKYGYFDYADASSGGYNDYTAHLIYSSFNVRF